MTTAFDNRRGLLKAGAATAAVAAAGSLAGCATTDSAAPAKKIGRVIVIGGGYGGATAAKYINQWSNGAIEVYLIDRERNFVSCPISNLVLGGTQSMETITHSYAKLREKGIIVLNDEVTAIDPAKKKISLKKIADLTYDRLVVSPGIDFNFNAIQGLNDEAQKTILHSWKAGPQTVALKMGEKGALIAAGGRRLAVPPHPCRPVDATGAGDTFGGAFVARLAAGDDAFAAARYAGVAAALSTQGYGAVAPIPRSAEVRAAMAAA